MSLTVVPRTFPYRPSGGFSNDDIWGGPSGPGLDDIPSGATAETKSRIGQITSSVLDTLTAYFQYKNAPQGGDLSRYQNAYAQGGYVYDPTTGRYYLPGTARGQVMPQSNMGIYVAVGVGILLIVMIAKR